MTHDMNQYLRDPDIALVTKKPPRQIDYVSLVQNFTDEKVFKLDFETTRDGWILFHYGNDLYGLYRHDGFTAYNGDFSINPFKEEQATSNPFLQDETGQFRKTPQYLVKFNREHYKQDKEVWKNYWGWKRSRNEKRSELEEQFGYDTKHAAHLIRLLRMGNEILEQGQVIVQRPDAAELLDIRAGKWKYEELVEYAESLDKNIREVLYKTSSLRHSPDYNVAAKVLMDVQDICWSKK